MTEKMLPEETELKPTILLHPDDLATARIDSEDIWAGDIGGWEKVARTLIDLLGGQPGPLTTCLNGAWGSGKTFFLRRLCKMYSMEKVEGKSSAPVSIYFNAWEDDSLDDPLIAIVGQLKNELTDNSFAEIHDSIARNAKPLLAKAAFTLLKVATRCIPGLGDMDLKVDDFKSTNEVLLDSYGEMTTSREGLREDLKRLADRVFEESGKPLLFVVDELDRCKPTFAIALLERVKHLFSVPHIVFLFGADKTQLGHTIQAVYGNVDIENYLLRFFEYTYMLPILDNLLFLEQELRYSGVISSGNPNFKIVHEGIADCGLLMKLNGFSLRQTQLAARIFSHMALSKIWTVTESHEITAIAIMLKARFPEMYMTLWDFNFDIGIFCNKFFNVSPDLGDKERDRLLRIVYVFIAFYIHLTPFGDKEQLRRNIMSSTIPTEKGKLSTSKIQFFRHLSGVELGVFVQQIERLLAKWSQPRYKGLVESEITKIHDALDLISFPSQ